ncbi:hypothetical protein DIPPA_21788 [Diplonema papillatum]|nr:hypothetical protein DIPPA_21799 [Diplonema papillatum]KAJ9455883.1 hypothetical protein DIPPA_21788 [Diplonema papillatum]
MLLLFAACAATAATPPWMNQSLSVNERVALLLPQLSLAELSVQLIAPDGLPPQSIIAQFANTSIGRDACCRDTQRCDTYCVIPSQAYRQIPG